MQGLEEKKVSIITPCYNGEELFERIKEEHLVVWYR